MALMAFEEISFMGTTLSVTLLN